jgi:phytoene/squalene synthetase
MNTKTETYLKIVNSLDFNKIKDHPNILIAANLWDEDRYLAAKTCYGFLRAIDDLIDGYKSEHKNITEAERELFLTEVDRWIRAAKDPSGSDLVQKELIDTMEKFRIPIWTMEVFAKSMIYDIHHDGFDTLQGFMEYTEGASIAPASIFVHLCGIRRQLGRYDIPLYDVRNAASPCAIFSYIVHIIRDFQKDQKNNLTYFADDIILKNHLTRKELRRMADEEYVNDGFRNMIREYYSLADVYRKKTYDMIKEISPYLEERYRLSLEVIFSLYLMVFERIDIENGRYTAAELNPTPGEIKERVIDTILKFNFS